MTAMARAAGPAVSRYPSELNAAGVTLSMFIAAFVSKLASPRVNGATPLTCDGEPCAVIAAVFRSIGVGLGVAGWR